VQRSDRPAPAFVKELHFEDAEFEKDKTYDYIVTAVFDENKKIRGLGGVPLAVTAKDQTKPSAPTGLEIKPSGDGVFLQWQPNPERDVTQYLVFRSDKTDYIKALSVDGYQDSDYQPGLTYWLKAVDESGNESSPSPPQRGP